MAIRDIIKLLKALIKETAHITRMGVII